MRIGRRARVTSEGVTAYRAAHAEVWPELVELNRASGIRNYTIFIDGVELFSYFEVDNYEAAVALLSDSELAGKWQALMAPLMDSATQLAPWAVLDEVFHQD
jgi:L-rhamnose mutarotase